MELRTYNQVADKNLEDLRLQTRAALEQLLQNADQDMAQGCADERAVCRHLWHAGCEVMSSLAAILCDP